ncbi:MAG: hypothetical protein LPJ95_09700 [Paracoccaceae bacterium]|nr:hypothetical protein [Paracoccaceae bacterium]
MSRFESVMSWFYRMRRTEDLAMRRIEKLGTGRNDVSGAAIPLFFAKRSVRLRASAMPQSAG